MLHSVCTLKVVTVERRRSGGDASVESWQGVFQNGVRRSPIDDSAADAAGIRGAKIWKDRARASSTFKIANRRGAASASGAHLPRCSRHFWRAKALVFLSSTKP